MEGDKSASDCGFVSAGTDDVGVEGDLFEAVGVTYLCCADPAGRCGSGSVAERCVECENCELRKVEAECGVASAVAYYSVAVFDVCFC